MTHLTRPWGGAGLAAMMWREAQRRTGWLGLKRAPLCREAAPYCFPSSVDSVYYYLLDSCVTHFYDTRIDRLERRATRCVLWQTEEEA